MHEYPFLLTIQNVSLRLTIKYAVWNNTTGVHSIKLLIVIHLNSCWVLIKFVIVEICIFSDILGILSLTPGNKHFIFNILHYLYKYEDSIWYIPIWDTLNGIIMYKPILLCKTSTLNQLI